MGETWKPVPGYEEWYEVSDRGQVRSWRYYRDKRAVKPRLLSPGILDRGKRQVWLYDGSNKKRPFFVHRLMLFAFVGPPSPGAVACHKDDDPSNNRLANLRWGTPLENMADRERNGHTCRGEKIATSKLTTRQVEAIHRERQKLGPTALARKYGVNRCTIHRVLRGMTWAHKLPTH
jgi:hypothetical protein